jgi:hypothetical protein
MDWISYQHVGNAYLQAPTREKVHTTAGPEFGPSNIGKTVIVVRAMNGLKSSGAAWHVRLSETLRAMDFKPSYANPDIWMKPATKANGFKYYDYILVYVDDLLVISKKPGLIMQSIKHACRLKDEPQTPSTYLRATIKPWHIQGKTKPVWSMSCMQYLKEAIRNVEMELLKTGKYSGENLPHQCRPITPRVGCQSCTRSRPSKLLSKSHRSAPLGHRTW